MPAAHMRSKYFLAIRSFSGVKRLGGVLIGGPEVSMKHSTSCRDAQELANKAGSVISGYSERRRENGGACTTC